MTVQPASGTSSDKTLSVMDLFTPDRPEWTVEEAASALGLSDATAYRYFRSLSAVGLVFSVRPGRYLLGPGIVHYDRQLRLSDPLLRAAEPALADLSRALTGRGRIFISRLYRASVMAIHDVAFGGDPARPASFQRGDLAPLTSVPALSILAAMDVRSARNVATDAGIDADDWKLLKRRMRVVREAGYVVDGDADDRRLVSVALTREDGGVAGSLNLDIAQPADDRWSEAQLGRMLLDAAGTMARLAATQAPA